MLHACLYEFPRFYPLPLIETPHKTNTNKSGLKVLEEQDYQSHDHTHSHATAMVIFLCNVCIMLELIVNSCQSVNRPR